MEKLRETVKAKVPFRIFKNTISVFFNIENIDYMGRDYESTFLKIDKILSTGSYNLDDFNKMLQEFLVRYLIFGKKIVYSFKLGQANLETLKETIKDREEYHSLWDEDGLDALNLWSRTVLSQKGKNKRYFLSAFEYGDFFITFWGGKRVENYRENIETDDLGERFKKYSDIYGIKELIYQSYDIVMFDFKEGTIDLLIENSTSKKISYKMRYDFRTHLLSSFSELCNAESSHFRYNEKNYFPCIEQFYKSKSVNVRNYGFKTDDGLFSDSLLKNRSHDLRDNKFIKGGSEEVKNKISGYSIILEQFNPKTRNSFIQAIPGTGRLLDVTNPKIDNYEFYNVFTFEDYRYIKDLMIFK